MSCILNCWGICAKTMPELPENKYHESKAVVREDNSPISTPSHTLTSLTIVSDKSSLTARPISDHDADIMFHRVPQKTAQVAHNRFVSTEVISLSSALKTPPIHS